MKNHFASIFSIFLLFAFYNSSANIKFSDTTNDTLTATFKVNGLQACKSNIESLLTSQAGVISAVWNSQTKNVVVVYKSSIVKVSEFYTILGVAGYDSSELRAKQSAYDALSNECKYVREPETE